MSSEATTMFSAIEDVITAQLEQQSVPGMAIGLYQDGQREVRGYGVVSLESNYPVLPITLFQTGSIAKVYTTTLVMQLVEEERIDLHTPIETYLPDLKLADEGARETVTLWHLLTHTTGFDGDGFDDVPENGCDDETFFRVPASLGRLKQWTRPGELYTYCNIGFSLAGALACRMLAMPLERAMRERVFEPLGLERSFYSPAEAIAYPMTCGHVPVSEGSSQLRVVREWYPWARWTMGDGGINCPVDDLLNFAAFHMGDGTVGNKRILSEQALHAMQTVQVKENSVDGQGLGWRIPAVTGPKVVGHGGGTYGWLAELMVVPERRFAIAIMANSTTSGQAIRTIAECALERFCGVTFPRPEPLRIPVEQLAAFAGRYTTPRGAYDFGVTDDGLRLTATSRDALGKEHTPPPVLLRPVAEQEFVSATGQRIWFVNDGDSPPRLVRIGSRIAERSG